MKSTNTNILDSTVVKSNNDFMVFVLYNFQKDIKLVNIINTAAPALAICADIAIETTIGTSDSVSADTEATVPNGNSS